MSVKKIIVISLAAIVLVLAVFAFAVMRKMFTPTEGAKIASYASPQKALLVIDVQEDYTGLKGKQPIPYPNAGPRIETINALIDRASRTGIRIVYIRQIFDDNVITRMMGGRTIDGKPGVETDSRIRIASGNDFTKKLSDAFSNPRLEAFLVANQVNELYLTGLDAAYCVYNTAMGGKNRGYRITVVRDAIMTRKDMDDVLKRYERDGIPVASSAELLAM